LAEILPSLRPAEVIRALERAGFVQLRQRGSHVFLFHPARRAATTIAVHNASMREPMLRAVLKQAGLSVDEFLRLHRS
jgi:predicted RNA binding protein YcfA (HicA-like mRNA interferase family)